MVLFALCAIVGTHLLPLVLSRAAHCCRVALSKDEYNITTVVCGGVQEH